LNHDTKTFVNAFHRNLVALYGSKQSAQLLAYAKAYVNSRYESLTVEHLARKKVPQSSAEYIAKKMFSESLIGFEADLASKKDDLGDKVKEKDFYKRRGLLSCFIKAIPEMDMDRYNRITREQLLTILDLVKAGHGYEKCKEDQPCDEKDILSLESRISQTIWGY
jgi:hypothetical protein